MIIPRRIAVLQKAFRLNPVKLHCSTGLEMRECIFHFNGTETNEYTDFTLQNFYSELEQQIGKVNRSLNLVQKSVI